MLHVVGSGDVGRLRFTSTVTVETVVEVDHASELLQVLKRGGPWEIPDGLHLGQ